MLRKPALALVTAALGLSLGLGAFAAPAASPKASSSPASTSTKAPVVTTGTNAKKNEVSGTIKNWKKDSFELQAAKGRPWKFSYDKTAKMEGTPANGAKAQVWWMDKGSKHWVKRLVVQK